MPSENGILNSHVKCSNEKRLGYNHNEIRQVLKHTSKVYIDREGDNQGGRSYQPVWPYSFAANIEVH